MATYVALLRGINIGGKNILPMKELVAILEETGCQDVTTYIQSGNVVFCTRKRNKKQLAEDIGSQIEKEHGFKPAVLGSV